MTSSSRRSFLRRGALAAMGVGVSGGRASLAPGSLPRVGIVGGGLAGVACGWLLDGVADAVIFESRRTVGGHAHTIPVAVGSRNILVDVGAQFFSPGPHPTYSKLLELIGLIRNERRTRVGPAGPEPSRTGILKGVEFALTLFSYSAK